MRGPRPLGTRDHGAEQIVDLVGVIGLGEPEPLGHAEDMGVDGEGGDSEGIAEHHVGRLPADPGQLHELVRGARDDPAVPLDEGSPHADQGARLGPEEAGRVDVALEHRGVGARVVLGASGNA